MQELIDDCTEHDPSLRPDADTIVARLDYLSSASHTFGLGKIAPLTCGKPLLCVTSCPCAVM